MARGGPEALVDVPLFSTLSKRQLRHIAGLSEEQEFDEGTALAEEGKPGDTFYVLLTGEAKVVRGGRRLDRLIPGDFFGEIALIDGGPRTASVVATTPVTTLTIQRKRFRKMLEEDPSIVLAMLEELAKRLRNNERSPTG
jgi:CRP/FNR family transcriptional regulator, cyclic AMP receptor protein